MKQKIIIWILALLLIVQLATAIGIRPARTNLAVDDYDENNIKIDGKFWVVNNDHREFTVDVYVDGEMGEFVKLKTDDKKLTFRPEDDAKEVEFEIKFKKEEVPPGTAIANIVIEERFENSQANVVSSKLILKHKINFVGPYPDLYIEGSINFHEKGNEVELVAEVKNLGKKDIKEVQTTFYVNDKEQKEHELETSAASLKTKETKLLTATIEKDNFNNAGQYEVSAVTKYDDQTLELYKTLLIGRPEVDITYFDKYLIANRVNQYTMDLLNKWNQQIRNVYVEVNVLKGGNKIDSFRTRSVDLEAEMMQRVSDYLDAKDKGPGEYTFEMTVYFWSLVRMDEKKFTFHTDLVTEEEARKLNLVPPALTGAAVGMGGAFSAIAGWLLVGILLGIIGFYAAWRYMNRKKYE
ncbi:MAG: CARDB domain-containing protein [Nanoarchaeota archaeon]